MKDLGERRWIFLLLIRKELQKHTITLLWVNYAYFYIYALGSVDVRIVVIYVQEITKYVDEDKLIVMGKFVLICFLVERCRGPPRTQKFKNFEYVGGFIYV